MASYTFIGRGTSDMYDLLISKSGWIPMFDVYHYLSSLFSYGNWFVSCTDIFYSEVIFEEQISNPFKLPPPPKHADSSRLNQISRNVRRKDCRMGSREDLITWPKNEKSRWKCNPESIEIMSAKRDSFISNLCKIIMHRYINMISQQVTQASRAV